MVINERINALVALSVEKPTKVIGINIIAWAKIIGITPAVLTFKGIYCLAPPYCLFPTTRFAYCTGTLRVPCTNKIEAEITNNKKTISARNITKPPDVVAVRIINSCTKACGRRAMIPTKIINEIPLPIPLSVMRSPNHIINILPAASIIVEETINIKSAGKAPCI